MQDLLPGNSNSWREPNRSFPTSNFPRDNNRVKCKKCGRWHGEKERCPPRPNVTEQPQTDRPRFDPRNRTAPRVAEAEMEPESVEEIAEETDEGSIVSGENEEHF
jgi:hypothetical protein